MVPMVPIAHGGKTILRVRPAEVNYGCMDRMQGTRVTRSITDKKMLPWIFQGQISASLDLTFDHLPNQPRGDEEQAFSVHTVISSTTVCFDASRGERQ